MSHSVVLFTASGCSLCDDARDALDRLDHPYEVASDPAYAERIPVVTVDGKVVTEGQVNERALRRALRH